MAKRGMKMSHQGLEGVNFNLFSEDDLFELHSGTLEVLKDVGVKVPSKEAQEIYHSGGCTIDKERDIVKIPAHVVEDAIESAPGRFLLAGRNPENDFMLQAGSTIAFTCFGEGIEVIDPFTRERRPTTKKDVGQATRFVDSLDQMSIIERPVGANEVPPEVHAIHTLEAVLRNASKHCVGGPKDGYDVQKIKSIAQACSDWDVDYTERPTWSAIVCAVSPLVINEECSDAIITATSEGVPLFLGTMVGTGSTGPVYMAGGLVLQNAEILAMLVLTQLAKKGHPCVYAVSSFGFDMQTTNTSVGGPRLALFSSASGKLAQYYDMPCWAGGG
jgi:trimethylamine--corrinoid protein Co-methyltransferase